MLHAAPGAAESRAWHEVQDGFVIVKYSEPVGGLSTLSFMECVTSHRPGGSLLKASLHLGKGVGVGVKDLHG
jgi:hypothetical protein